MSPPQAGTRLLLRATIRHDGRRFAPWLLIVTALSVSSILAYLWIFPDHEARAALAATIGANPAMGIVFGPAFDLMTSEGFNAWRSLSLGGFLTALGAIFAVTGATRGQEDSGQAELLASGVLGRSARLSAGVGLAGLGSLTVGVVAGAATGLVGGGWQASMLLGATFTVTGWMFCALAAVTAQVSGDGRTANSLAVGTLGTLFLLRGFFYAVDAPTWLIWLDPLSWLTETRPGAGNRWWPLAGALAVTAALLAIAYRLQSRRDFGHGTITPRPGPARGRIRTPWALTLRLSRGPVITWLVAFIGVGVVFGYFATSVQDLLGTDSGISEMVARGEATSPAQLLSGFIIMILSLVAILAAVPGVQILVKVHTEESENRLEPVLAGAVSRPRYYAANVVLALVVSAVSLLIAGLIIAALAAGADIGVGFSDTVLQTLAIIPAVWAVIAVAVLVIGVRPQLSLLAWIGVLVSFTITLLGPTFQMPDTAMAISPFWHVPEIAAAGANWWGVVWTGVAAAVLIGVGFAGFRRRDLAVR